MSQTPYIPNTFADFLSQILSGGTLDINQSQEVAGDGIADPLRKYDFNDRVWIKLHGFDGSFAGRIAGKITPECTTEVQYVIKLDNYTWPQYEVREAAFIGSRADDVIPNWYDNFIPDDNPSDLINS